MMNIAQALNRISAIKGGRVASDADMQQACDLVREYSTDRRYVVKVKAMSLGATISAIYEYRGARRYVFFDHEQGCYLEERG